MVLWSAQLLINKKFTYLNVSWDKYCPQLHQGHSTEVHEFRQTQKKAGLCYLV